MSESFKSAKDLFEEMIYGTDAVLKRRRKEEIAHEQELAAIRSGSKPPSPAEAIEPLTPAVFSHSPTYQKLTFMGKEYDLTQHKYAPEIVRVLHESLKSGESGLTTVQIRKRAALPQNGGSMYDWLRGTGLWKHLVVTSGRDLYRLDIP